MNTEIDFEVEKYDLRNQPRSDHGQDHEDWALNL